jgi:hypothetical protein
MTDLRKQAGDHLCLFHAGPEEFETIVWDARSKQPAA